MRKAESFVVACIPVFNEVRAMDGVVVGAMKHVVGVLSATMGLRI